MFFKKKYEKIFIVSCVLLDNGTLKITYLLDNLIEFDIYKGFFEKTIITSDLKLYSKLKYGKWIRVKLDYVGNIVYLFD